MVKGEKRSRRGSNLAARADLVRREATRAAHRLTEETATRWRAIDDRLPFTATDVGVQARRGGWHAARLAGAGLAALPSAAFDTARNVAGAIDDAADRSEQLGERAREFADDIPASRRRRRRSRLRVAGVVAVAFTAGAAVGWTLAQRRADQDTAWLADHLDAPAQAADPDRPLVESEDGVEAAELNGADNGHHPQAPSLGSEREAGA